MTKEDTITLLLSDARGIYIPRDFTDFDMEKWHIKPEDIEILKNPNHEYYWDAWNSVIDYAYFELNGHKWSLYQDGDLFAVREDHKFDSE